MDFIDQIDLEATAGGAYGRYPADRGYLRLWCARGGIDLNQIDKAPSFYFTAVIADAARRGGNAGFV